MLEEATVLHRGGLVLWHKSFSGVKVRGNPVNQLIKTVLLADRTYEKTFVHDTHAMQWLMDNKLDLVFIVVYQHLLTLSYIQELLDAFRSSFCRRFSEVLTSRSFLAQPVFFAPDGDASRAFTSDFEALYRRVEARSEALVDQRRKGATQLPPRSSGSPVDSGGDEQPGPEEGTTTASDEPAALGGRKLTGRALAIQRAKEGGGGGGGGGKKPATKKAPPKKEKRIWGDAPPAGGGFQEDADEKRQREEMEKSQVVDPSAAPTDINANWVEEEDTPAAAAAPRGRFGQWMRNRFGQREIDGEDLDTLLPTLKDSLMEKNVAQEIAENLTDSVSAELKGKKVPNFTSLSATIKQAMETALYRILTPKRNVDILRDVQKAKAAGRPYVITFCGVNGVGKSTNLSKIAYWLKGLDHKVLIAACDTFRSGAVEQLQVHSRRIGVPVFQKGYVKDAAEVAQQAIQMAKRDQVDVVLVDTAGRMQDNRPLMSALAKLIHTNKPDLVLFVGEALVGNDGVDQLRKFNRSLEDLTPVGHPQRGIDGIVLTKFDTIDDKVGAAISMVHESGQPIVFVGVGQAYQDLRSLNPGVVVQALLR
eukprot:Hpha_TRINITY_DN12262_c0_g1::TRINITY_DN12262_c0_g1_i1::g.17070::m.17070/K13431/SRPR; signal recognition particle receptor subunit alpha